MKLSMDFEPGFLIKILCIVLVGAECSAKTIESFSIFFYIGIEHFCTSLYSSIRSVPLFGS
jgi:hypothetical protein